MSYALEMPPCTETLAVVPDLDLLNGSYRHHYEACGNHSMRTQIDGLDGELVRLATLKLVFVGLGLGQRDTARV